MCQENLAFLFDYYVCDLLSPARQECVKKYTCVKYSFKKYEKLYALQYERRAI